MASWSCDSQHDLCMGVEGWLWGIVAAWLASPLVGLGLFLLMRRYMAAATSRTPFVLQPAPGAPAVPLEEHDRDGTMRVLALNMCLLPGGLSFSGSWLIDGNDKKDERIDMLLANLDHYDVMLLNEMWGCWWSSFHTRFFQLATERGFYVCASPVGMLMDSGNVIVSRYPLSHSSSWTFKNASGWQSLIPNGVLHAICTQPSGARLHLFTTHLQCTSAPTQDMATKEPVSSNDVRHEGCLSGVVRALGDTDSGHEAVQRLQQLHELTRFVHATTGIKGHYIVGGDLNIEGGSKDYQEAANLFGRHSTSFPDFAPTFSTRSFLTPPGWRDVDWSPSLDYIFSNLDVCEFQVLPVAISDHLPLHLVVSQPVPECDMALIEDQKCKKLVDGSILARRECFCHPFANTTNLPRHSTHWCTSGAHHLVLPELKVKVPLMFEDVLRSP